MGRTGIMGGTFNPVHIAHIKMAESAYRQAGLDRVVFMPSKNPPHKKDISIIPEKHRGAMVKLAVRGIPYFEYSDFEFKREGITYSATTLELLHMQNPQEEYFFIMGGDSFFQIESWYMPGQIMEYATIIATGRNGAGKRQMEAYAKELENKYNARILLVDMPQMDISSSCIRKIILSGGDASMYLPEGVWEYIKNNRCYCP